jgi:hypothetical protein
VLGLPLCAVLRLSLAITISLAGNGILMVLIFHMNDVESEVTFQVQLRAHAQF